MYKVLPINAIKEKVIMLITPNFTYVTTASKTTDC